MTSYTKYLVAGLLSFLVAFSLSGCGGDSNGAATGPDSSAAFANTSITFNPTVNFLAGNAMTYINTEAGSPFPAAASATNGTYTYTPNASFTGGTLTLTIDGIASPVVLEVSGFRRSGRNVTAFTVRSGGQNFNVTVTGALLARAATGGGTTVAGETSATDIPGSLQGTYSLVFFPGFDTAIAGVPAAGTQTSFVIGARTLAFSGKTLSNPVFFNFNNIASEWLFKDGPITYAVSISGSGGLNEINLYGAIGPNGPAGFFGQYRTAVATTLSGGKVTSGTFNAVAGSVNSPTGFPAASAIASGASGTFTFGATTLTFDGVTFTFSTIDSSPGSDTAFHIYTADVGGQTDTIRVGVATAGSSTFVTTFTVERKRTAEAPTTGVVTGSYFFRVTDGGSGGGVTTPPITPPGSGPGDIIVTPPSN
jgi:hypothetical protein